MDKTDQEKDEKDVEKYKSEKESAVTTESLSEALKKVNISQTFDNQSKSSVSGSDSVKYANRSMDPSWLLSKNISADQQVKDNKLEEMEMCSKKRWLVCSSENSPILMNSEILSPSRLPDSLLAVAQAGINSWLMKSYS